MKKEIKREKIRNIERRYKEDIKEKEDEKKKHTYKRLLLTILNYLIALLNAKVLLLNSKKRMK